MQSLSRRLELDFPLWHSFSVCGAAPDPDPSGQGDSGTGGAGDEQQNPPEGTPSGDPEARIRSLTEAIERNKRKEAERDQELNELREFRRKADEANLTETERVKSQLSDSGKTIEALTESNRRLAINNAFLANNTVLWHDAAAALKLVDLSAVEVENGEVKNPDALKVAIDKLAKDSPWLVATEENPPPKKKAPPKSGDAPQGGKPDPSQPDFEALARTYPALRHHRPYQTT